MPLPEYYRTLGVGIDATAAEIKLAYRRMARKHSSDLGGDEELYKKVNRAYETLRDPDLRAEYDGKPTVSDDDDGAGLFTDNGQAAPPSPQQAREAAAKEAAAKAKADQARADKKAQDAADAKATAAANAAAQAAKDAKAAADKAEADQQAKDTAEAKAYADALAAVNAKAAADKAAADKASADQAEADKKAKDAKATADKAAADKAAADQAEAAKKAKASADKAAADKAAADQAEAAKKAKATADKAAADKAAADQAEAAKKAKAAADAKAYADGKKVLTGLAWIVVLGAVIAVISWQTSKPSQNELFVQGAHVAIQCFSPDNLVPFGATIQTQMCTEPVKPSGIRRSELIGIKAQDVANLCTDGYQENWSDNQGNNSDACYGFDESADGWLVAPFTEAPAKPGPWIITWRMTSRSGKVVLEASYKANEATPDSSIPLPAIPAQVTLTCFALIGGQDCTKVDTGGGDILYLGLTGIDESTILVLCSKGYKAGWTQNLNVSLIPLEGDNYARGGTCSGSSGGGSTGILEAEFSPPGFSLGPWIITWRLTSPSGNIVLEVSNKATMTHS